jgi:transposase
MAKRRNFSPEFNARVALAAIRGDGTLAELPMQYNVHPNVIAKWKKQALVVIKGGFQRGAQRTDASHEAQIKTLQAKIGELVVERDFLAKAFDR